MERNLTKGSVFKAVVSFSLPFLLSYFLQTLYGMADLFIIGQYCGVGTITAVSIGSQIMHMFTVMIVGLSMGSTVLIGQAVGGNKKDEAACAIGNTVVLFMALSVAAAIILLCFRTNIAAIMSTPSEAFPDAVIYLTICFIGIPFITAYNIISSIFRGLGDSKSPMYFIAAACAVNIALDYLFIGGMDMGAAGAALGTVLSQTASVLIAIIVIRKKKLGIPLSAASFRLKRSISAALLKIGVPVSLQDGFIQISFVIITIIANRRGLTDAAAVGIVEKIIGILFLVPSSMLSTVSALSAQNIGAGKPKRAGKTLAYGILISVIWGIAASFTMLFASDFFVGLFSSDPAVVTAGSEYMRGYVWDSVLAGVHFCFSGFFCAYGFSSLSFIHNSISIVAARIPLAYTASILFPATLFPMGLASTSGSALSVVLCTFMYIWLKKSGRLNGRTAV